MNKHDKRIAELEHKARRRNIRDIIIMHDTDGTKTIMDSRIKSMADITPLDNVIDLVFIDAEQVRAERAAAARAAQV